MWKHRKYKSEFKGRYVYAGGDRVFQLVSVKTTTVVKSYESHEAAKKDGWKKGK